MRPISMLAGMALVTTLGGAAAQGVITNSTPSGMIPVLQGAGYSATLDKSGRNPVLRFKARGYSVNLEFIGCSGAACRVVNASAGFDLKNGMELGAANKWNAEHFSMVYLDEENDPFVESAYRLSGGFTKANFLEWFKVYLDELEEFDESLP